MSKKVKKAKQAQLKRKQIKKIATKSGQYYNLLRKYGLTNHSAGKMTDHLAQWLISDLK